MVYGASSTVRRILTNEFYRRPQFPDYGLRYRGFSRDRPNPHYFAGGSIGTTGLAANAYQAGAMIPQTVFTLVSGGIFNAVLVPQIVRTLKERDAQERLNRLITLAIGILLAVTVVMAAATPLLARLYVGSSNHEMIALTTAFTLWCMPQVFFYGLYTVLGQILAAKDHFASYAWSSTGANVISCAGFTAFIMLFGKANEQPLDFWTSGKVALTAGTWTLGVAFQALILFVPLIRLGFKYRPSFGLTGFGLKAMGPVALGSLGVVAITQISDIVLTRIATLAPQRAHELTGVSLYDVAGNATYQNAFTLYILPYSLIAVSVSTARIPPHLAVDSSAGLPCGTSAAGQRAVQRGAAGAVLRCGAGGLP